MLPAIKWYPIKQSGNAPTGRQGHTIVTFGKAHIMFGGIDLPKGNIDKSKILSKNELYTLRISALNSAEWTLKSNLGDIPPPRSHHAACKIDEDHMLVFGGNYDTNTKLNDIFYVQISNITWSQPPNQKAAGDSKNLCSKIGAPEPRSYHTVTYHKGKVYVFGGHGGSNYRKVAFNDIYEIDTENGFKWGRVLTKGTPPEPRGGHTATILANRDKLMVFGGWNSSTQFSNTLILDLKTKTWQDPQLNHEIAKWNIGGIMIPSVPNWRYFIFGGSVGQGANRASSKFVNDTWFLDNEHMDWVQVHLEGTQKPKARDSAACFYSQDDKKLFVFGGWADNWLNDLWALPVDGIERPQPKKIEIKIHITIWKQNKLISQSFESPECLIESCLSKFLQFYNVTLKEGSLKGKILDKSTYLKPIADFATGNSIHLLLAQKRKVVATSQAQKLFLADKVISAKDSIKLTMNLQTQKSNGQIVEKKLEQDVKNLTENVVSLIQTQESADTSKVILESYERSVQQIDKEASKKLEQNLKDQTKCLHHHPEGGCLNHHPVYILGQALKYQSGAQVTYSQDQTAASVFSMLHLSTMFGSSYKKGFYTMSEKQYSFNKLQEDEFERNIFILEFKKEMAAYYNTTEDKIIVEEISRGSINVAFYYQAGDFDFSKSHEKHLRGKLVKEEQIFKYLNLSARHFDSKGDINFFNQYGATEQVRGRLPYYQPGGWIRYGLDVRRWIRDGDKDWLKMDGNDGEWAVMFHGIKSHLTTAVKSIAESTLLPGGGQAYRSGAPIIPKGLFAVLQAKAKRLVKSVKQVVDEYRGETTTSYVGRGGRLQSQKHQANSIGVGVYGSPLIQTCGSGYCGGFKVDVDPNSEYIVAFQCRVRPQSIRICEGSEDYWVIRDPADIRPYGLLITKKSIINKSEQTTLYANYRKSYYERFIGNKINLASLIGQ